jgi:mannose-6-phosphate isomerase-like protein (cupin superfamily)
MRINTLTTAEKVPFNIDGRKMYVGKSVEVIHLSLKPGEALEKHTNPFDVVFYIIQGEGIVETDAQSATVEPDMCIEIPNGIQRGVKNTSESVLRMLVVKIL